MYSYEALQILIFLIPGFIASAIMNILLVRKVEKEFAKIIEALIFSMIVYAVYLLVNGNSPVSLEEIEGNKILTYDRGPFLWLVLLSLAIPLIFSFFVTNDLHMKVARALGISRKTSRSTVWFDVFCDKKCYVIINFENGRRIYGWPQYFSNTPEESYVFLYHPAWVGEDNEPVDIGVEGILITPEQKIESIEFLEE